MSSILSSSPSSSILSTSPSPFSPFQIPKMDLFKIIDEDTETLIDSTTYRLEDEISFLNKEIIETHFKHFENSTTGLVIPTQSPNSNIIYHLYSTGEISSQKGGWAYLRRSEFMSYGVIPGYRNIGFIFPNVAADNSTYVVLTEQQCIYYRTKMVNLIRQTNDFNIINNL